MWLSKGSGGGGIGSARPGGGFAKGLARQGVPLDGDEQGYADGMKQDAERGLAKLSGCRRADDEAQAQARRLMPRTAMRGDAGIGARARMNITHGITWPPRRMRVQGTMAAGVAMASVAFLPRPRRVWAAP